MRGLGPDLVLVWRGYLLVAVERRFGEGFFIRFWEDHSGGGSTGRE
jgi:hypothetical protein